MHMVSSTTLKNFRRLMKNVFYFNRGFFNLLRPHSSDLLWHHPDNHQKQKNNLGVCVILKFLTVLPR